MTTASRRAALPLAFMLAALAATPHEEPRRGDALGCGGITGRWVRVGNHWLVTRRCP